jgi:hypothetical protein
MILTQSVFAAEFYFGVQSKEVGIGETFEVGLFVNTQQESLNTFSGTIHFPTDTLELVETRNGNSIVSLWVEKPKAMEVDGKGSIQFSGIVPGGYNGHQGMLLSFIVQSKHAGEARIGIESAQVLRNDGEGTSGKLAIAPITIVVLDREPNVNALPLHDETPPDSFIIEIVKDDNLYEGKYVLVFQASDKISGIDYYEVKEISGKLFRTDSGWRRGESPYVLVDQILRSDIQVKAVDKKGNERIVSLAARHPVPWYEQTKFIVPAGVLLLLLIGWYNRRHSIRRWLSKI